MEFEVKPLPMLCGSHEAQIRTYRKYECARGVYLVAIQDACADNVYFHDPKAKNSQGFAGRTLEFTLEDSTVYKAQGPWKVGVSRLKQDCGVDIEDKFSTFVVVGKGVRFDKRPNSYMGSARVITDVLHMDDGWKISKFDRYKSIVRELPPGEYQYYCETAGGSTAGRIRNPEDL